METLEEIIHDAWTILSSWRWWVLCTLGAVVNVLLHDGPVPWFIVVLEGLTLYIIWLAWEYPNGS